MEDIELYLLYTYETQYTYTISKILKYSTTTTQTIHDVLKSID